MRSPETTAEKLFKREKEREKKKKEKKDKTPQNPVLLALPCKIHNSWQQKAVKGKIITLGFPNPSSLSLHDQNVVQDHIKSQMKGENVVVSQAPGWRNQIPVPQQH